MFSPSNLLVAIAVEYSPIPIGLWGLFTLDTDTWVHGDGSTATKQPGIVSQTRKKLEAPAQVAGDTNNTLDNNTVGPAPLPATGPDSGSWLSNFDGIEQRPAQTTGDAQVLAITQAPVATQAGGSIQVQGTGPDSGRWLSNSICIEPTPAGEQNNEGLVTPLDVSKPSDEVEVEHQKQE